MTIAFDDLGDDCVHSIFSAMPRKSVPDLICCARGLPTTCKQAWRIYLNMKTVFDGAVIRPTANFPDRWDISRGYRMKEMETDGDDLKDPYSIVIVRNLRSPGREVLVFFVYGLAPLGGRNEFASRVTAIKFVSVFCTKDAHTQIWNAGEAFDQSLIYSRVEEREATACKLPFVGVDYLKWGNVYPDLRPSQHAAIFTSTGHVAIDIPSDVDRNHLNPNDWGPARFDASNRPAVFDRDLLRLAGKEDDWRTLNSVPFVLSVETPTIGFHSLEAPNTSAYRKELVKHLLAPTKIQIETQVVPTREWVHQEAGQSDQRDDEGWHDDASHENTGGD